MRSLPQPTPRAERHDTRRPSRRRRGRALALGVALATALTGGIATAAGATSSPATNATQPDLGPNVVVFDPSMPVSQIQATVDAINAEQIDAEMGTGRHALLFKPGIYGTDTEPLQIKVGYYTEVAGLGASPTDVVINGKIEVYNRCLDNGGTTNCLALVNFWRTLSNLTLNINGAGQDGCRASADFWAVSQAVSMRRLNITGGNLSLMDYCTAGPQFASGGYIADTKSGFIINGSQQQWLTRNSDIGGWSNGVWNAVFSGVVGAPTDAAFPKPPYTTLDATPVSREKPFLFIDGRGRYNVYVPTAQQNSRGVTWANGMTPGHAVPITDFFVVKPSDSVQAINNQLARGRTRQPKSSDGCTIIEPVYIEDGVTLKKSKVGPNVSIGTGSVLEGVEVSHSIIGERAKIYKSVIINSLVGDDTVLSGVKGEVTLGDHSEVRAS